MVLAVALQRLLENGPGQWSPEENLVLDALRRSKSSLSDATPEELAEYINGFKEPERLQGVLNNVKGIYHELLFAHAENTDGDNLSARLFDNTNHPGADLEFLMDGEVVREIQLKSTTDYSHLAEHLKRYPDIELFATSEIANTTPYAQSTGYADSELTDDVQRVTDELKGDDTLREVADGAETSALVSAAFAAGRMLKSGERTDGEVKTIAGDVAVGGTAALILELLVG